MHRSDCNLYLKFNKFVSFLLVNTHILFLRWRKPAMQALQIALFLRKLHEFASSFEKGHVIPWVFSGDFNIYPHYPAYEMVTNGKVAPESLEKLNPLKYNYPQVVKKEEVQYSLNVLQFTNTSIII